jgi:hypothetical protein
MLASIFLTLVTALPQDIPGHTRDPSATATSSFSPTFTYPPAPDDHGLQTYGNVVLIVATVIPISVLFCCIGCCVWYKRSTTVERAG